VKYVSSVGEHTFEIDIDERGAILVDGQAHTVDFCETISPRLCSLLLDNVSLQAFVENVQSDLYQVLLKGQLYQVRVQDERVIRLARGAAGFVPDSGEIPILAPMPGLVVRVPVSPGDAVQQGQPLLILESMKMDNELCAPRSGTVERVHVEVGQGVESGQTLLTLE
jgi:biotin carboxyl carrier protein